MNVVLRLTEAAVEFLVWWVGGWGLQSHFRVQPNYCVEGVLRFVVVGVVTIPLSEVVLFPLEQPPPPTNL